MAYILCLETSTDVCSVSLSKNEVVLASVTITEVRKHSAELTTAINTCIANANINIQDLSAIAISDGPGSYTGLRVGASTAKGMCMALGVPLITIPTLYSLAHQYFKSDQYVMPTIDARRMEVYTTIFRNDETVEPVHSFIWEQSSVQLLAKKYSPLIICGNGISKAEHLFSNTDVTLIPCEANADWMVPLAHTKFEKSAFVDLAYHDPFYFKSPNITIPKKLI